MSGGVNDKARYLIGLGPVLEIGFGPPTTVFGSLWSSQKARKFRHIQQTTKTRILCFAPPPLDGAALLGGGGNPHFGGVNVVGSKRNFP